MIHKTELVGPLIISTTTCWCGMIHSKTVLGVVIKEETIMEVRV